MFTITYVYLLDTFWVHCRVRATSVSDFRRACPRPLRRQAEQVFTAKLLEIHS